MNTHDLLLAFDAWRAESRDLVLASVYETAGSTYSKPGARMLITTDGRFQGMLSGGCLEGDLAERAVSVARSATPQTVTYDLGRDDDTLWGLGVGCDGLMRIFLQPLVAADGYQPFAAMAEVYAGEKPAVAATVLESGHATLRPGATLVRGEERTVAFGIEDRLVPAFTDNVEHVRARRMASACDMQLDDVTVKVLFAIIEPPPRILMLGGGLDAEPVVRLIAELGWRVVVQDHRPAYIARGDFRRAERAMSVPLAELGEHLQLSRFDAAIVMSHHLQTDRAYLQLLCDSPVPYVGLLGPVDRRRQLMHDLGPSAQKLAGRLHGPAGLDIGGRGPAAIALSIVAEVHRALMREKCAQPGRIDERCDQPAEAPPAGR